MHPKTHEKILTSFGMTALLGLFLLIIMATFRNDNNPALGKALLGWFIGFPTLTLILIYLVPIHCDAPYCGRHMHAHWKKEARFQWSLFYRCDGCGHTYNTAFTFTFGGPSDY